MPIVAAHPSGDLLSVEWLRTHGVVALIIIAVAFILSRIIGIVVGRTRKRLERVERFGDEERQRVITLSEVIRRAIRAVIWTLVAFMVLDQIGVNLGPLIAGAGIAGVALGFGAQSLVKDFLTGFFILLENQFHVGDVVDIQAEGGRVLGRVEAFSMRITQIRDLDGSLHFLPNGTILEVGNRTELWARAVLDVGIGYGSDVDRALVVIGEELTAAAEDADLSPSFIEPPEVLGVEELADSAVVIRTSSKVVAADRLAVLRELRRRLKIRLDAEGIEIPFPQRTVWTRTED